MATKAVTARVQHWLKTHPTEWKLGVAAAAYAFFFTHGLPLWNEDYSLWLGKGSWGEVIGKVLLPFSADTQVWGYGDRWLESLIYRVLSLFFGTWGTGYFLVKSLFFGALCGAIYHFARTYFHVSRFAAVAAVALFASANGVMGSVIQLSDFGVLAQFVLVALVFWAIPHVDRAPTSPHVFSKGWDGIPKPFREFLLYFLAFVYFGSKIRADVRLAPIVLLTYVALRSPERFQVLVGPFAAIFALSLPWSPGLFKALPPISFAGPRWAEFFFSGALDPRSAPQSYFFGGVGALMLLAVVVWAVYLAVRERFGSPDKHWHVAWVWLAWALGAAVIFTPNEPGALSRMTLVALVPTAFLFAGFFQSVLDEFPRVKWVPAAVAALVAVQAAAHVGYSTLVRKDNGHQMVAVDELHRLVEKNFSSSQLVYLPGVPEFGYRKDSPAPAIQKRKGLGNADEIAQFPVGATYAFAWYSSLDPRYSLAAAPKGCSTSLFDTIFSCNDKTPPALVLLKYVGAIPELARADELSKAGDLAGAKQVLEEVYSRDRGNHGVGFMLSMVLYRLGDNARLETLYDEIGPYFRGHPSVVYNWGLAKQATGHYAESQELLEAAYKMLPLNYGVGFNLAENYWRQGLKKRALATLGELRRTYPNDSMMKHVHEEWTAKAK